MRKSRFRSGSSAETIRDQRRLVPLFSTSRSDEQSELEGRLKPSPPFRGLMAAQRLRQPGMRFPGPDRAFSPEEAGSAVRALLRFLPAAAGLLRALPVFKAPFRYGRKAQNRFQIRFRSRNVLTREMNKLQSKNSGEKKKIFRGQSLNGRVCNRVIHKI